MNGSRALRLVTEALQPGAGGQRAALRRRRQADWTAPLAFANAHVVAPSLYVSLRDADALEELPEDVRTYLAFVHEYNGHRNGTLRRQALELVGALCDAGVRPLLLKGGHSLFLGYHRDPAARMIGDLDILVDKENAEEVFGVLQNLGYSAERVYPPGHHAYADFARANDPAAVDLHFELIDATYLLPAREVWERARSVRVDGREFAVPSPTDCVMHNLLHAQIHYLGNFYRGVLELRQLYDFATLARHYADEIDWAFIAERMMRYRLEIPLQSYLLAAGRLFALDWPLAEPPSARAKLHYGRCATQLNSRALERLGIPWGNVRASFAWHRMSALYHRGGHSPLSWIEHVLQYSRKKNGRAIFARPFRVR